MDQFNAPFGELIEVRQVIHDTGVTLLRLKVIDGGKFFQLDLDPATATRLGHVLKIWAEERGKPA